MSLLSPASQTASCSPRNIPTVQHTGLAHAPTELPIVNARTHRDPSQCPNIPQYKTHRRLFTQLLTVGFIMQRPLLDARSDQVPRFLLSTLKQ